MEILDGKYYDYNIRDLIEFEKSLLFHKYFNNINCGILLSINKPFQVTKKYEKIRKTKKSDDDEDIFYALSTIDNITVLCIYLKNNPENIQGYDLLQHCLEEGCLQI